MIRFIHPEIMEELHDNFFDNLMRLYGKKKLYSVKELKNARELAYNQVRVKAINDTIKIYKNHILGRSR